jgi:hypothetical protein
MPTESLKGLWARRFVKSSQQQRCVRRRGEQRLLQMRELLKIEELTDEINWQSQVAVETTNKRKP